MEADRDGKTKTAGLYYAQCDWGDLIKGTKGQLQALGLGIGRAFPGEVGGPKSGLRVRDPRGFDCEINSKWSEHTDEYSAYLTFPNWPKRPGTEYAKSATAFPGVMLHSGTWFDGYSGKAADLIAAGLVKSDQLPGLPGMPKVRVVIYADGTSSAGEKRTAPSRAREAGAGWVRRTSKYTYQVGVIVSEDEAERRRAATEIADDEWKRKVRLMRRPARLQPLPETTRQRFDRGCSDAARDVAFQGFLVKLLNTGAGRPAVK